MKESPVVLTTRSIPRPFEIVEARAARRADVWLWPNLLSLQAPFVAVLWQLLMARSLHVRLHWFEPWALGAAVWLIYVGDHLIDTARPFYGGWEPLRKEFCRRHWRWFFGCALLVGFGLAVMVRQLLWIAVVTVGWRVALGVVGYFALIHLGPGRWRTGWPREVVVAAIFAAGTFGAVWLENGRNVEPLVLPAVFFMVLCCANCSVIEMWEWEASGAQEADAPNRVAAWVARQLAGVGVTVGVAAVLCGLGGLMARDFAVAVGLSGVGLVLLAFKRREMPVRFVSLAADLALCAPVVVLVGRG